MFPLILAVLSRDDNKGYNHPFKDCYYTGGTSQNIAALILI